MNIIQITPGAGAMYCGNCLRDNALVRTLRRMGHEVLMVPMYLPLTLDEPDESANTPIFFSGVSVYLEQQSPLFRKAPEWFHQLLSSRKLLRWAAGRAAKTRAAEVGALTLSMLRGEEGNQARELGKLIDFLKEQPRPDVICLSNLLLTGLVRRFRTELGVPVVCLMQGEEAFLDGLPESHKAECWRMVARNAAEADLLISTSRYYADRMRERLSLPEGKVRVVFSGISLEGYDQPRAQTAGAAPVLGFFARMCHDKGLDTAVEAFIRIRQRGRVPALRLHIGGSCGPSDEPLVGALKKRLADRNLLGEAEFFPNLDRARKLDFLHSLSVFSVPARYGEAFGLYLVEAMAAGVPVVQPRTAAFPELIEASKAGLLCEPENADSLAECAEQVLMNTELARNFSAAGKLAARDLFSIEAMARNVLEQFSSIRKDAPGSRGKAPNLRAATRETVR